MIKKIPKQMSGLFDLKPEYGRKRSQDSDYGKKVEERKKIVTGKSWRRRFGFDLHTAPALLGGGALLSKAGLLCDCFVGSQGQHFTPSAQRQTSHSKRDFRPWGMRKQAKYGFDVCRTKVDLKSRMLFWLLHNWPPSAEGDWLTGCQPWLAYSF